MNDIRRLIQNHYYETVKEDDLNEGAIAGLVNGLKDPYSVYFTKSQMESFIERNEGSYVGIGVRVQMGEDGILSIVEVLKDSPAQEVGLKKNDKIIEIDKKDITSIRDEEYLITQIKGTENTKVVIGVYRPSIKGKVEFTITRSRVKVINVMSEVVEGNIGLIRMAMFDGEVEKDFNQHLDNLLQKGIRGLVIDVRDNPGGNYDQVVAIADRILPAKKLIVYTQDKQGSKKEEFATAGELDIPIVVLINGYSASASEVLAAALKDNEKAILIGTKSYGKGLVQSLYSLKDGSGLKITIARYFTPSGKTIHKIGLKPDIEVQEPDRYKDTSVVDIPRDQDTQLNKAIQFLKSNVSS